MKTPSSLDDNLIYQIGEIARMVHKSVTDIFAERKFDVTVEQFGILAMLWYEEGIKQQDIANKLKRNKATITRIIENMMKRNLIVQIPDQLDKRNKLIYLTQKGKALQKEMVEASGMVYYQALNNIDAKEIESVLIILKQMTLNLKEIRNI